MRTVVIRVRIPEATPEEMLEAQMAIEELFADTKGVEIEVTSLVTTTE